MRSNKPIKILLISSYFYPHVGGSQRYMEELYVHLRSIHPEVKVDVLCYNTDNTPEKEEYRGLHILRIPCLEIIRGRFAVPQPFALLKILRKLSYNKYDFVHTHLRFFDQTWWSWIYAKSIGARSIFTEHVASHPVHQFKIIEFVAWLVDKTIAPISINHYDIITTTNISAKQFLLNLGIKKSIHIVYGGVDTKYFSPKNTSSKIIPKVSQQLSQDAIVISYIGRMIWTKGVTYLYESIKKLLPELNKHIYFVLAGDGELYEGLKKSIISDNFTKKVFLTGNLNPLEVRDLLRVTDIFVYPSHHSEGLPN
ncbi:MAG: glycosyltransferase family 4 protein, partial [Patescibacteria group bacterium]